MGSQWPLYVVEFGILRVVGFGIPVAPLCSGVWDPLSSRYFFSAFITQSVDGCFLRDISQIHAIQNVAYFDNPSTNHTT